MKIAILGAGISGISLFDILKRKFNVQCDIYEKELSIGGLCRTDIVNDYIYDLSGGHVFNSKYKEVREYVFSLLDESNWQFSRRNSNIMYEKNKILDYPFEFSLSLLPVNVAIECIEGLYDRRNKNGKVKNFADFLINTFGLGIYNHYLKPYNEKIWKTDLKDMDFDWVDGKMPYPKASEILTRTLSKITNETDMVHSNYYYPKFGGIQTLMDRMGDEIPKTHIGEPIEFIAFHDKKVEVNGNIYDVVINTVPLPELGKKVRQLDGEVEKSITELKFNSVLSYLYPVNRENDWSWTYIPNYKVIPHRIVYQGNLADNNAPRGKSSITVEITKPSLYTEVEILKNIEENLGLSNPIAKHFTQYAYVVFDLKRRKNMQVISEYFSKNNILLHGRFAEWTYPNMDICIKNSMNLAEKLSKYC